MRFRQAILSLLSLLFLLPLAACEYYKLQELNYAEPTGTAFEKALWANYRALSKEEERNYDWSQAVIYADKALRAAYGEEPAPENPADGDLSPEMKLQFEKAREDLLHILAGDAKTVRPQLVADAQTNFDCWLEKQHENFRPDDIAFCRENFYDALQELLSPGEMASKPSTRLAPKPVKAVKPQPAPIPAPPAELVPQPAPEPKPELEPQPAPVVEPAPELAPKPAPEPMVEPKAETVSPVEQAPVTPFAPPPVEAKPAETAPIPAAPQALPPESKAPKENGETASYIIFFDSGQAVLTPAGEKIVDDAARSLVQQPSYRVVINGRTDVFGNASPELPAKRAQMVKDRLILQGIAESAIELQVGEPKPAAGGDAAAPTPVARRVEIFISE